MQISELPQLPGIAGQIALVTGATRGIGRSIAEALGRQGATVIGTATSAEGAGAIGEHCASIGVKGRGIVLDVSDEASIAAAVADVAAEEGAPTILVNNAGITRDNLLLRMKDEEWQQVIATNLTSIFRMCKAALRDMIKAKRGRIINIGSVVGSIGNPGQANYAATKAGIVGFSKSLAREVASRNITVNTIAPGFIESDMTRALSEDQVSVLRSQIPMARLGAPEDVAAAVVFLVSDCGSYITGETLHINGGLHME